MAVINNAQKVLAAIDADKIPFEWAGLSKEVLIENADALLRHIELNEVVSKIEHQAMRDVDDMSEAEMEAYLDNADERSEILTSVLADIKKIKQDVIQPLNAKWLQDVDKTIEMATSLTPKIEAAERGEEVSLTAEEKAYLQKIKDKYEGEPTLSAAEQAQVEKILAEHSSSGATYEEASVDNATAARVMSGLPAATPAPELQSALNPIAATKSVVTAPLKPIQLCNDFTTAAAVPQEPMVSTAYELGKQEPGQYSFNENVQQAQQYMARLAEQEGIQGIDLATSKNPDGDDGIFGPKTEAAVRSVQEALGMEVTGKITPEFMAQMENKLCNPTLEQSVNGANYDDTSLAITFLDRTAQSYTGSLPEGPLAECVNITPPFKAASREFAGQGYDFVLGIQPVAPDVGALPPEVQNEPAVNNSYLNAPG